jgi:hypothetical protein
MRADILRLASGLLGSLSLVLVGCEDPPPPTPAGAFALQFRAGGSCGPETHNEGIGQVGRIGDPDLVSNGANDALVECTVEKAGAGFNVTARLKDVTNLTLSVKGLSAENADEATAATGSISYSSPDTSAEPYASADCKFWVDAQEQYVKAGAAWFSFICEEVTGDGDTCEVDNGFVALKNCLGTSEEEEEEAAE